MADYGELAKRVHDYEVAKEKKVRDYHNGPANDKYDEWAQKHNPTGPITRWEWDGKRFIQHTEEIVAAPKPKFPMFEFKRVAALLYKFDETMNAQGALGWRLQHYTETSSNFVAIMWRPFKP